MIKKFTYLVLVLTLSHSALASDDSKMALKKQLAQLQSFSAKFQQKVSDALGEELQNAEGILLLKQPQKLYWESYEPNEMQLIADGDTLWHVDPFVEQVVAINQQNAAQDHPVMLLAQPDSPMWQHYLVEETAVGSFTMKSLKADSDFISLTLSFTQGNLTTLTILDKMEQTNQLFFSEVEQNQPISDERFTFTLPEGYSLDDQR